MKFKKLCKEYKENKRLIKEIEEINEGIRADIIALMNGKEEVKKGGFKAIYKKITSSRVDTKGLKQKYTDIYNKFLVETKYHKLTIS